jgi:hypothetical protein
MTDIERQRAREKDKERKQEKRKQKSKCETTEEQKIAVAARTAACRNNMTAEKTQAANEKARVGMQESRKRRKKNVILQIQEITPRKQRTHPIARKNVKRVFRFIKESGISEELIVYFNEEKQEWLHMNSFGVHYRQKKSYDNDEDYEIVQLIDISHMNFITPLNNE